MLLCRKVGSHYPGLDVELLETGAVLHDFGKIDELCYERAFGYTLDGQLIGHLVMETLMVAEQIAQIPDFPDELRRQLLHILLAHHGKLEHGSPKLPMTPEALVVAYLDDLDSKVEAMQRLIAEPHNEGDWSRISPMFERPIYRRRANVAPQLPTIEAGLEPLQPTVEGEEGGIQEQVRDGAVPQDGETRERGRPSVASSFNTPFAQLADLMKK